MFTLNYLTRHVFGENVSFFEGASLLAVTFALLTFAVARYFGTSGPAYWFFWGFAKDRWAHRKIQQTPPNPKIIRGEIWYGFWGSLISGGYAMSWVWLYRNGLTRTYFDVNERGWGYFWFSVAAMVLMHDAYFYWTHRAFHHRKIYKIVHHAHHISVAPTPWAAWGFHPYETLVGGFYMFLLFLFMPMHPNAFFLYMLILTGMNCLHHLGYEIAPRWAARHWLGRWVNWTTHHDLHHKAFNCNYGFYFGFWDSICGTHHRDYLSYFEKVTTRLPGKDQSQGGVAVSGSEAVLFTGKRSSPREQQPATDTATLP